MEITKRYLIVVLLSGILVFLPEPSGADEKIVNVSSTRPAVSWTQLIFQGSKLLNRISVEIELGAGGQISGDFSTKLGKDIGGCTETADDSKILTVRSSSTGVGFSENRYQEIIWFNGLVARPEKRIRLSNGESPWVKSYCWEEKGVRRQKILPGKPNENKQPPTKWTKRTESFYQYPQEVVGCDAILDPVLVFYILSAFDSGRLQSPFELCVFGRKQLHQLTIAQEKTSPLKVSYKVRSSSQKVTIDDKISPRIFSISTAPLAPDNKEPETFSFLGLNKEIRIYMDPEKRLPVRISGTNNSLGKLVLDLKVHSQ